MTNMLTSRIFLLVASCMFLAANALAQDAAQTPGVLSGIDVLQRDGFKILEGQRVGLITNHTGRNRDGVSTVQLFHDAQNVKLTVLFSPEHGFEGKLDVSKIDDTQDASTGLKVYSLYGETRRPTTEMLAEVDAVVFDIQDIGTRFYTYNSTMGEAMRAAAVNGKKFVVLDRPNPINGVNVTGPMLDAGAESFVGYHSLPVRHGMTSGELAAMFRAELKLDLNLVVVPCEGWNRSKFWESTGLTWVNPSPNMRSLTEALLYPGIGLLEMTNISVGRGTDTPFEVIGAPWMDGRELARRLNAAAIPGVIFVPIEFIPDSSKYVNEQCHGINIAITNRETFEPVRMALEISVALRALHPDEWETKNYNRLLGSEAVSQAVLKGLPADAAMELADKGMDEFLKRRSAFMLYR